jgi:cyclic pyranopterin phosphate synthase
MADPSHPALTHTDVQGKALMVDVGHKNAQKRTAVASGKIELSATAITLIMQNQMKKGDVLTVAEIAGIQAAKRTADLIPLCHAIPISSIQIHSEIQEDGVQVTSEVISTGQTGVEMEAITAVSIALITIYDMCKSVDKTMRITDIVLCEKTKENIQE